MIKTVLKVDGMMCGMCEAHINDAIRNNFKIKKVTSSHKSGTVEIAAEDKIDHEKLKETVVSLGYTVLSVEERSCENKKNGLFGLFRK